MPTQSSGRFSNFVAWVLVFIGCLLTILGCLSTYIKMTTLDTKTFVKTVGPIIKEPAVTKAISEISVDRLFSSLNVSREMQRALPKDLGVLSEPMAEGLEELAIMASEEILVSEPFYKVWEETLRITHTEAVNIITGRTALDVNEEGAIVLDISKLLNELKDKLAESGISAFKGATVPENAGHITLFKVEKLGLVKQAVDWLQKLFWILPFAALAFFALAFAIARNRRKVFIWLGSGLILAMLALLGILAISKIELLGRITDKTFYAAAGAAWSRAVQLLFRIDIGIIILGFLIIIVTLVTGPYDRAVRLREGVSHLFRR